MTRRFIVPIVLLIINHSLFGSERGQWVICSGEAAVQNITVEEAQALALKRARLDAIEKVCGVSLQSETLVKNFMTSGDFIHAISYGEVIDQKDVHWTTETLPSEISGVLPVIVMHVSMNACVATPQGNPDPSFKVTVELNRTAFQSGDEAIIQIKATKDCHLTLLSLAANDSVYILFPNAIQRETLLRGNVLCEIPDEASRQAGFHIRVATLPGHRKDTEVVKAIATKQNIPLPGGVNIQQGFGLMGTPRMAVMKLAAWLSEIPPSERAEASLMYTVSAK